MNTDHLIRPFCLAVAVLASSSALSAQSATARSGVREQAGVPAHPVHRAHEAHIVRGTLSVARLDGPSRGHVPSGPGLVLPLGARVALQYTLPVPHLVSWQGAELVDLDNASSLAEFTATELGTHLVSVDVVVPGGAPLERREIVIETVSAAEHAALLESGSISATGSVLGGPAGGPIAGGAQAAFGGAFAGGFLDSQLRASGIINTDGGGGGGVGPCSGAWPIPAR